MADTGSTSVGTTTGTSDGSTTAGNAGDGSAAPSRPPVS